MFFLHIALTFSTQENIIAQFPRDIFCFLFLMHIKKAKNVCILELWAHLRVRIFRAFIPSFSNTILIFFLHKPAQKLLIFYVALEFLMSLYYLTKLAAVHCQKKSLNILFHVIKIKNHYFFFGTSFNCVLGRFQWNWQEEVEENLITLKVVQHVITKRTVFIVLYNLGSLFVLKNF